MENLIVKNDGDSHYSDSSFDDDDEHINTSVRRTKTNDSHATNVEFEVGANEDDDAIISSYEYDNNEYGLVLDSDAENPVNKMREDVRRICINLEKIQNN